MPAHSSPRGMPWDWAGLDFGYFGFLHGLGLHGRHGLGEDQNHVGPMLGFVPEPVDHLAAARDLGRVAEHRHHGRHGHPGRPGDRIEALAASGVESSWGAWWEEGMACLAPDFAARVGRTD